ncbi:TPA: hypothetical protein ACH3X3_004562 [Trebouxia sp. C0006]
MPSGSITLFGLPSGYITDCRVSTAHNSPNYQPPSPLSGPSLKAACHPPSPPNVSTLTTRRMLCLKSAVPESLLDLLWQVHSLTVCLLLSQEDAVAGTLRPLWAETLLPIYSVDARTLQRVETLEQSFLHHQQQVQTQLDSMQEQLTALSQKQLDTASFPEQVVHHIEQDLAEVISRLDRQVDALMGRVDRLPSPEDWTIMEEALAAILDEAAARAQQQEKLKELDAAQEQTKEEDDDELFGSLSRADSFEQQSADGNSMAVVVKEESEDQLADALLDQEQLEQMLQQQQAEVQSRLDLMNEKMENWVVQCFSDLRTRIIDLEATSLVAKAEVLQASIGVSCNEVDIQATTQDHNEVDVQATTQDHNEDASEDAHPENSSAVQDGAGIDGGVDAIDAEEVPCRHSVQAMPLSIDLLTSSVNGSLVWLKQRLSQLPLSQVQWSGVAMALVAAMVWFGAIELWTRNTETLQMAH